MDAIQIKRLDRIIQELLAVENNTESPECPEAISAAKIAVRKLEKLMKSLEGDHDFSTVNKTGHYLGDIRSIRSGKKIEKVLQQGINAHHEASAFPEATDDKLEMAKLQLKLANTIRLIHNGRDRSLIEEARRRYYKARELFKRSMPGAVSQVEDAIEHLEIVSQGLNLYKVAQQGIQKTKEMQNRLLAAGADRQKDFRHRWRILGIADQLERIPSSRSIG